MAKTVKVLMKELENRSAYSLAWAVIWRWFIIVGIAYIAIFLLMLIIVV